MGGLVELGQLADDDLYQLESDGDGEVERFLLGNLSTTFARLIARLLNGRDESPDERNGGP